MSKPNKQAFYLVSAFNNKLSFEDNLTRHLEAIDILEKHQVPFKVVTGMYKGNYEKTFLIPESHRLLAYKLMIKYDQESILYVAGDRSASLINNLGIEKFLGVFKQISKIWVEMGCVSNYTYDGETDTYYTTMPISAVA